MAQDYEIIIIGGGPGGAHRGNLRVAGAAKDGPAREARHRRADGADLGGGELPRRRENRRFRYKARSWSGRRAASGSKSARVEVTGVAADGPLHRVSTTEGELTCRSLVITAGARSNRLGAPGEAELAGRGVSYCATCDGAFYQGVPVAVVGGGDTALEEALFLTRYASRVYLVHRRSEFRGTKLLQERIAAEPKIEPVLDAVVERIEGTDGVTGLAVKNLKSGAASRLAVEGAFIFVGTTPNTEFLRGFLPLDAKGFIETTPNLETTVPGVFAAGDVRAKVLRQISTAVGEGALAATMADHHLSR